MDLRKINNRLWKFVDEEIGEFSPSKFTINRLNNEITIVYFNNLQSKTYNVSDVYVYDVPPSIAFNTSNGDELMTKLEELNCPCFQKDETIVIGGDSSWGSITGDIEDQTDLIAKFNQKQDNLNAINLGQIIYDELAIKLTPSPNDTILGRDFLTNEAVEINYPIAEGYFNGTNFYLESGFVNLITATSGRTYTDLSTNLQYRWSGADYVQIGGGKERITVTHSPTNAIAMSTLGTWASFDYRGLASTTLIFGFGTGTNPDITVTLASSISIIPPIGKKLKGFYSWMYSGQGIEIGFIKSDVVTPTAGTGSETNTNRRFIQKFALGNSARQPIYHELTLDDADAPAGSQYFPMIINNSGATQAVRFCIIYILG